MDIDGSNPTQVVSAPVIRFTYSSDGRWLVYSAVGGKGVPALWKVPIEGGQAVVLNEEYWGEMPTTSPDGKYVTFQYMKRGAQPVIAQALLESGEITDVLEPPFRLGQTFRWTPNGNAIAYIDNSGDAGQIWAIPRTGGPAKQLTNFTIDSLFWFDWSRDGKQLAVSRGTQLSDVVLISDFR
jgi:Tol biopolymer transport system component